MSIASLDEFIFAEFNPKFQPSYLDEACETSFYILLLEVALNYGEFTLEQWETSLRIYIHVDF